jgi:hypothetical protein
MTNVDTTTLSWKGQLFFLATLILTKNCLQLISSKCSNILLTTYLFYLMDVFCNYSRHVNGNKLCSSSS